MKPTLASCSISAKEYIDWLQNTSAEQSDDKRIENLLYVIECLLDIAPDGYAATHLARCAYACESRRLKDKKEHDVERQRMFDKAIDTIENMERDDLEEALHKAGYYDYRQ